MPHARRRVAAAPPNAGCEADAARRHLRILAKVNPTPLLAAAPILAVLALMLGARWSAARAGAAGLALALLLAIAVFGFGSGDAVSLAQGLAGVLAEGGFVTATVLWILWPALALYHHQQRGGAFEALRAGLARLTARPALQALLLAWFLALFLEGAAGFGTPVALVAPLLVGLGFEPRKAVVLALLGHAVGVSFGAIGTPVAVQAALTGLDPAAIAWRTALLNAAVAAVVMAFFVHALRAPIPGAGNASVVDAAPVARWATLALVAFLVPSVALATGLGPELPTLGGALLGGLAFVWMVRRSAPPGSADSVALPGTMPLPRALAPYLALIALVAATRAVPALTELLREWSLHWRLWDRFEGRMHPLLHPGTLLLAALLLGAMLQGHAPRALAPAFAASARRLRPVALALLAMLCLSRLMLHAGMIDALQQAATQQLGRGWPLLAPTVGALGSFVTGSATASNVLLSSLQVQVAQALGLSAAWMAAAQGMGAGIGNIICPHNVVAGAATVGLAGREGEILRGTLLPALVVLAVAGVLVGAVAYGAA
jgi:lactate permease